MRSLPSRLLFWCLLGTALAITAELGARVALWARDGAWPASERWREERKGAKDAPATVDPEQPAEPASPIEVVHPFLGFVLDPAEPRGPTGVPVAENGFRRPPDEPAPAPSDFIVAVFGGSVAEAFSNRAAAELGGELSTLPQVAGRPVRVVNYAVGGHKQPQQLLTLNYFLALGERIDLVVVLDGFNEIVLPVAENLRQSTNPYYPRGWPGRVRDLPDLRAQLIVGEVAYLRLLRTERSAWCDGWLTARSAVCHLYWSAMDRRLGLRLHEARQRLASSTAAGAGFLTTGPPYRQGTPESVYADLAAFWARSSRLMHDTCSARGIPYFHFLQPNQYVAGSKPMGRAERLVAIDDHHLYKPYAENGYPYLKAAGARLAREGVSFHDLTMVFAATEEAVYRDACCHFNLHGYQLLGRIIGARIAQELRQR